MPQHRDIFCEGSEVVTAATAWFGSAAALSGVTPVTPERWGNNLPYGNCMFGIAELTKVALERCDSARCAVQTMGALAEKYGFYSEDSGDPAAPLYFLSAESAAIADPNEVWLFHVLTGPNNASAIWAAVRVPDDHVSVMADGMVIRELDLEDGEHYLASSNVHSYAIERGWWNPEEGPFDFTAAYAFDGDFVGEYPFYPLYVGRRIWRVLSLFAPSLSLDPRLGYIPEQKTYPVSVRADRQGEVTVEDVMTVLRDHYQGTEFDTSKGAKAGPFGNPTQYDPNQYTAAGIPGGWERPISVFRQLFSFVAVSRAWLPDEIGGMFWFGQAQAHTTAYVPIYASATHAPRSYRQVLQTEFSQDAAWWAFNFVSNWANLKYAYMSTDIQAAQAQAQALGRSLQLGVEATALSILQDASWDVVGGDSSMNAAVADMLTSAVVDHANRVTREWWALAWRLVAKYSDGYIARTDGSAGRDMPGYPEPWLKAVGFEDFPGESFINPRAPQPEPAVQDNQGVGELMRPSHKASRREIM
eukprot:jgi/Tetstr1/465053/TSEL_009781.t1